MEQDRLQHVLDQASRRRRALAVRAAALHAAWRWLAVLLACFLLDALAPLPPLVRCAIGLGLLLAIGVVAWRLMRSKAPAGSLHEALAIERFHGMADNALVNGWSLTALAEGEALANRLARRAVEQAEARAEQVDAPAALHDPRWRVAADRLLVVLSLWTLLVIAQPRLVSLETWRLLQPWGDHPPFSLTTFDVQIEPQPVLRGQDVEVRVQLGKLVPDSAELVEVDEQGQELRRWPMRRMFYQQHQHVLQRVLEPMRVQVHTPSGRSRTWRIDPQDPPPPTADTSQPQQQELEAQVPPAEALTSGDSAERALEDLADAAAAVAQQGQSQQQQGDAGSQAGQDDLRQAVQAFAQQAQAMSQSADAEQFQAALADLQLPPLAGAASDAQDYARRVSEAASHDAQRLQQALGRGEGETADDSGGQVAEGKDEPAVSRPAPKPSGQYDEQMVAGAAESRPSQAVVRQAPPAYRALVEAYFQRVAQDQGPRNR